MKLSLRQIEMLKSHPLHIDVMQIANKLKSKNKKCFIVGGGVRDLLLGILPKDLDLVSDATPQDIKSIFHNALPIGESFGIMVLPTTHGPIELATFRKESEYSDGRHPDKIEFSDINEDSKRRDFTVNSMYLDLDTFVITDLQFGLSDLKLKLLKTVGDPQKRFKEDKLRLLRLVRFAIQLNFTLDTETLQAAKKMNGDLKGVSKERIREELLRALKYISCTQLPVLLNETHLAAVFFKNAFSSKCLNTWSTIEAELSLNKVDVSLHERLFLFCWLYGLTGPDLKKWLIDFKIQNDLTKHVLRLDIGLNNLLNDNSLSKGKCYRLLLDAQSSVLVQLLLAMGSEDLVSYLKEFNMRFDGFIKPKPLVKSVDLKSMGINEGPQYTEYLNLAYEHQLEYNCTDKNLVLDLLKKIIK